MQRDLSALQSGEFDVVVVGGGIFGICIAWDAASRGLSVALLERGDFAHAASANCFKMVHGGIRYLQHGDLPRIRESSAERRALLRIAPHQVAPLPILIPTERALMKSKAVLQAGFFAYELATADRNRGISDPRNHIGRAKGLSKQQCLELFPGLAPDHVTGGVLFHDGQMYNPARLALSILKSAVDAGAIAANYAGSVGLLRSNGRVIGVEAKDTLSGASFEVRGRIVVNAAGGWAQGVLNEHDDRMMPSPKMTFSRDTAMVLKRRLTPGIALAVQGGTSDPDARFSRGNRHLFMVPWRDKTLLGVWHGVHEGNPDDYPVTQSEIESYLTEFNASYRLDDPLTLDDVALVQAGLVLFGENAGGAVNLSYGKRSRIVDHAEEHGVEGLLTVVGVRYTTARGVATKTVDIVFGKQGLKGPRSLTASTPVHGGDLVSFEELEASAKRNGLGPIAMESASALLRNHGTDYPAVLGLDGDPGRRIAGSHVLAAEVIHAVRREMAVTLSDVVFRRTELGTAGNPGDDALEETARIMAMEMGWTDDKRNTEIGVARAGFPSF